VTFDSSMLADQRIRYSDSGARCYNFACLLHVR
jgi:hypothetical protein